MRIKNLSVYAGLCAGAASMAAGQGQSRQLERATAGQGVEPIQIAKVRMDEGRVVFQSDWMPYTGGTSRGEVTKVFDCYGDCNSDGVPDDCSDCEMDSMRWYFPGAYCNLFWTNDMNAVDDVVVDAGFSRADFAWFWTAGGSGTSEPCVIALFTQESQPCDADSQDYSGWLLDFGTLDSSVPGEYYYTNADLGSDTWVCPTDGIGSYYTIYAQGVTTSGAFILATCAQPMLWGTMDEFIFDPDEVIGTQGINQFDERVVDLFHPSSECFTYSTSDICPGVIGAMMQFWGERSPCYADFNNDGFVNTQDFLVYLGAWAAGDLSADCDENGTVNTQDFLCFLGLWASGC